MGVMASQNVGNSTVYSTTCFGKQQRKHQNSPIIVPCAGNPPVTGGFPSQRASIAENSTLWRHHASDHYIAASPLIWNKFVSSLAIFFSANAPSPYWSILVPSMYCCNLFISLSWGHIRVFTISIHSHFDGIHWNFLPLGILEQIGEDSVQHLPSLCALHHPQRNQNAR